jgi:single-strand DNA-binding protein
MSSFTLNRVTLIGRLTKDPELVSLPSGSSVCNIRIACNSFRRDADGGFQEKSNFFNVATFGSAAESTSRYMRKGSRVAIDGRLEWQEWETSEQQKREAVKIIANMVMFLDNPSGQGGGEPGDHLPTDWSSASEAGDDLPTDWSSAGETGQRSLSELGLRPARELLDAGTGAEEDDLVF